MVVMDLDQRYCRSELFENNAGIHVKHMVKTMGYKASSETASKSASDSSGNHLGLFFVTR